MKRVSVILFLLAFAIGAVFFACSNHVEKCSDDTPEFCKEPDDSSDSGSYDNSSDSGDDRSSSSNKATEISSSSASNPNLGNSSVSNVFISSSSLGNSSPVASSSSRAASSSSSVSTTPTCAYQASWCGNTAFSSVTTTGINNANSATNGTVCVFATSVAMMENGNLYANGTKANNCGNSSWGQPACTDALASIPKADGGYYIYAPDWYDKLTTTGGTPNCNGNVTPGISSSSRPSSSSTVTPTPNSSQSGGSPSYTPKPAGSTSAKTTQYWDACKPSCSWSGKGGLQANSCNITGSNIGHNDSDRSACDGGNAFTCMNQAPWKVGSISFGYAAINMGSCGDCYQLDFPNGHIMVVMKSNVGNLNEGAAFDLMIPGGGVGDFDALSRQVTNSGVSNPDMGSRYGGFRLACNNSVSCVKQKCDATFKNLPDLRAGCNWYADNLGTNIQSFDNPTVKYQKVDCPTELKSKY